MKKASQIFLFALALLGVNAAGADCPPSLKDCCKEASKCSFKLCHSLEHKSKDTVHCDEKYCKSNPSHIQCWNPDDHLQSCKFGLTANDCTPEMCFKHKDKHFHHCSKAWCQESKNQGKFGCATPSVEDSCTWDAKSCTYDFCQTPKGKTNHHCKESFCHQKPYMAQCWSPTDKISACEYGDSTNCTPKICIDHPHFKSCSKKFCASKKNKDRHGCAHVNEHDKCTWDSNLCNFKYCAKKGKDNIHCTLSWCKKNPASRGCWDQDAVTKDSCRYGLPKNCNNTICHHHPDYDHCKADFCAMPAHSDHYGCAQPSFAQNCEWNGICSYDFCLANKNDDKTYTKCSAKFCKQNPTATQCTTPIQKCQADEQNCNWNLCNQNLFNKESVHCNTKWCSSKVNDGKFGCKISTLTVNANAWQQDRHLKDANTKKKAEDLLKKDEHLKSVARNEQNKFKTKNKNLCEDKTLMDKDSKACKSYLATMKTLQIHVDNKEQNVKADKNYISNNYGGSNYIYIIVFGFILIIGGASAWWLKNKTEHEGDDHDHEETTNHADDNFVKQVDQM